MKTFPLTQTLRRSLGACSIALGLLAALPAAAGPVTFTAPGQTLGFDVTLDLNSLAKEMRFARLRATTTPDGPYAALITFQIFDGLGGTGTLLYTGPDLMSLSSNFPNASGVTDGSFSVMMTMTTDPSRLTWGNLSGVLANGGLGVDLTASASVRDDPTKGWDLMSMNVSAIPQATVPEPTSLALVALAGLLAGGLKRRAAHG